MGGSHEQSVVIQPHPGIKRLCVMCYFGTKSLPRRCLHPDLVTFDAAGDQEAAILCHDARSGSVCGPDATLYKPRFP